MPFIGNGRGSDKIAFGPDIVVALDQLRAGTSTHWFTYNFEVSRQRGELLREGVRMHDGAHPFRRVHQVRREKNRVHYDADAREKLAALAEAKLEARIKRLQNKVNNVGRPLDRYDHRRNALEGWDHPVEEPPVRQFETIARPSFLPSFLPFCLSVSFGRHRTPLRPFSELTFHLYSSARPRIVAPTCTLLLSPSRAHVRTSATRMLFFQRACVTHAKRSVRVC